MNGLITAIKADNNFTLTENGALTHKTTHSYLLDMFATGGAMRNRQDNEIILMFKRAFEENPTYALKCLFYLRDIRGGQGERRFFRICMKWLAENHPDAVKRNLKLIPEYGRWDDLYCFVDTCLEDETFQFMHEQFLLDLNCKTPSLLGKWLASENATSEKVKQLGKLTAKKFGLTPRKYRQYLSELRTRINVLEKLMSENRWEEIEFDKIPSRAGLIYKNAFAKRDIIKKKYEDFARDTTKKVNAEVLNPVDIAERIFALSYGRINEVDRLMYQKYWDNLKDYYNGRQENGIAVVDVSGSMYGKPLAAAVSMGAYIAERGHGPFANHFITFSQIPELVEFEGVDIVDKFIRARSAHWNMNTNIQNVFDLLLRKAKKEKLLQEDMPERIYIFSDMEFDRCTSCRTNNDMETLLEGIAKTWAYEGFKMPHLIFWNLDARQENIPALNGRFSYISGFSMNMIETILSGKDGYDLMLMKLDSSRYEVIR